MNQPYFCFCLFSLLSFAGRLVDLCFAYLSKQNLSLAQLTHMGFCGVGKCAVNPFICTDVVSFIIIIIIIIFIRSINKQMRREELNRLRLVGGFLLRNYSRDSLASHVIHAHSPSSIRWALSIHLSWIFFEFINALAKFIDTTSSTSEWADARPRRIFN